MDQLTEEQQERLGQIRERLTTGTGAAFSWNYVPDVRFLLSLLDGQAAVTSPEVCIKCGHLKLNPWRGHCQHETSPFGERPITYCGCNCEFHKST